MSKVRVVAKRDHLASLTTAPPLSAIAELVWNGFDAGSDRVQVLFDYNKMDAIQAIRVRDYGTGITHSEVAELFGNLGESWKRNKGKQNGRSLHGKNGKGRFKAFALGEKVEWNTTYRENGNKFTYGVVGNALALDDFDVSDPVKANDAQSGTEVIISNLQHAFHSLQSDSAHLGLAKIFAPYLMEYPDLTLDYDGVAVDPHSVQNYNKDYPLGDITLASGQTVTASVSIIEWKIPTDRVIHLCDKNGISLHELPAGKQIRAPGFNFTIYIKSDYFRELDKTNLLSLSEIHPEALSIINAAKNKIKEHFRLRILENQGKIIERWKEERIYPYDDKPFIDPVETAERQVFEILAVNVQSYLPSFEDADFKSKKFTFRLLAQAIRENPESVQKIIGEVLGLKKQEQDDLAALLKKTTLSSIISTSQIVANRLDFLTGLENLLFDKETKKAFLERDQLHKILENESWIFHEEFALAGSEQRLEEVLNKHLGELGKREEDLDPVITAEGKTGRVDLMLHKTVQPRTGEYDYLVIELKRPSQKINAEVLRQIEGYAMAVANDERFLGVPAKWTFIAVSNELDDFAKRKANQRNWPKGKVYDDAELNITVWAKSWADIINDARSKLRFLNEQLSYEADRDSSKDYLTKAHAKFIPVVNRKADENEDTSSEGLEAENTSDTAQ